MKNLKLTLILLTFALLSCGEDEEVPETEVDADFAIVETQDSRFPVAANHRNGEHIAVEFQPQTQLPNGVFYKTPELEAYLEIDENGIPHTAIIDGNLFLFANYEGDKIDMAIIRSNGESQIFRELNISNHLFSSFYESRLGRSALNADVTTALKIGGLGVSIFGCALSAAMTLPTAGLTLPLAIGCGSALLSTIATMSELNGIEGTAVDLFGNYANLVGCNPSPTGMASCVGFVIDMAGTVSQNLDDLQSNLQSEYNLNNAALQYGYGAIQITLTWDNTADLDLYVTDPTGETIYYVNPTSASGGQLDVDDIDGYGPENIFWTAGTVLSGNYSVEVNHFSGASPTNFDIRMDVFGEVQFFSGSISGIELT